MKRSLGICVGASTIKIVEVTKNGSGYKVEKSTVTEHECNPGTAFSRAIENVDREKIDYTCVTGRKFKDFIDQPITTEPVATEYALDHFVKNRYESGYNGLLSLGSENFVLYEVSSEGNIISAHTGNKCASGTGEFFLQQVRRMNMDVSRAIEMAHRSEPYKVAGRCSVFCKSDCTHALNKGIDLGEVCAGLSEMIIDKISSLLNNLETRNIVVVGGLVKNSYIMEKLKTRVETLIIPEYAEVFEALGAAIYAHEKRHAPGSFTIPESKKSFSLLPPLKESQKLVRFRQFEYGEVSVGDRCILGLDVGSTTTKAVLIRQEDNTILAGTYLRTNGNPVAASRECYKVIGEQVRGKNITIAGLGVTGSGRRIAGLHALTPGVVNEIIAHAGAAAYFDKEVDTILEIGGQDAKYTFLVNGVPCDYAMNEACSAGTGSFLEEAARESLNINYLDIEKMALSAAQPLNFNDQCSAFINSDIKSASHENAAAENIVAGLVYSVCKNYINRVMGLRKIGKKIFMQGGVCYNKAVPLAMAGLLGREIVVPPEPGLMGAFGVALEVKDRIRKGLLAPVLFRLEELSARKVSYGKNFICKGKSEHCDRGCEIRMIIINNKSYPFGGICDKYFNSTKRESINPLPFDKVKLRNEMLYTMNSPDLERTTVGISTSFYTNTLFPLYYKFFTTLGFEVILPGETEYSEDNFTTTSFCYPAKYAYNLFTGLVKKNPGYIFMPHILELFVENIPSRKPEMQSTCLIAQSEQYYINSTYRQSENLPPVISPVLNFRFGWHTAQKGFIETGKMLGKSAAESKKAFSASLDYFLAFKKRLKQIGQDVREWKDDTFGIVLFGRPYNAFEDTLNGGIPGKLAARGYTIIPYDCLPFEEEEGVKDMSWALGQELLKSAAYVKRHPRLFGLFITNFSCGQDSFIIRYFRDIMGTKPSLTIEMDSHTSDAGINTRIEAFLDIVIRYNQLAIADPVVRPFTAASLDKVKGKMFFNNGELTPLGDKRIKILIPSMGTILARTIAAAFRGCGFNAESVPLPVDSTLKTGKANSDGKECLPLTLLAASLLEYLETRENQDELLLYFLPSAGGNCRFAQYHAFVKELIKKKRIANVALFSLENESSYVGMSPGQTLLLLKSIITADVMDDIQNSIFSLAKDPRRGCELFQEEMQNIIACFESGGKNFYNTLENTAASFSRLELTKELNTCKRVLLAGDIFARKDEFCNVDIIRRLARHDIVVKRSPVLQWLCYTDYAVKKGFYKPEYDAGEKILFFAKQFFQSFYEKKIKRILAGSGLYQYDPINIDAIVKTGMKFVRPQLMGETILVIGEFFDRIIQHYHGVISIAPFACLHMNVVDAILSREAKTSGNERIRDLPNIDLLSRFSVLPYLYVETDGIPFPQIVESKIEAFCLQVERVFDALS